MGRETIEWRELAYAVTEDDGNGLLDSRKASRVARCNTTRCTICVAPGKHNMQYRPLKCTSASCSEGPCEWRRNILTCPTTHRMTVYEAGSHWSEAASSRRVKLTRQQKKYCEELAAQQVKSVRVRNALRVKFGLQGEAVPRLRSIQNFTHYYSKTQLGCNDDHEEIVKIVREMAYQGEVDDFRPITFTDGKTADGLLYTGDGSDEEPFVVGITTRTLLARLDRDPSTFIFHIDTTFKLSQVGYPVLVMGISDRSRSFHLVAFCILSQRIESVYTAALCALRAIYTETTGKQIRLKYVMGDAESGQLTALEPVFRYDSDFVFLMCFLHVMKKVQ